MGEHEHVRVAVIGSGFGGLGAAVRLRREGITDFVVLERADSVGMLGSITVPTLVIVGEHDQVCAPADAAVMAANIPGAELATVDGAGHMSNLENPEAFNAVLLSFVGRYAG